MGSKSLHRSTLFDSHPTHEDLPRIYPLQKYGAGYAPIMGLNKQRKNFLIDQLVTYKSVDYEAVVATTNPR